jgi:hypothetical protein
VKRARHGCRYAHPMGQLDCLKQSSLLAATLGYPAQIIGETMVDLAGNNLGHFVWMKRAQFILESLLSLLAHFEKDKRFVSSFDLLFPAIDRFDAWQDICACGKLFPDQLI